MLNMDINKVGVGIKSILTLLIRFQNFFIENN